jgi:oligosaccharide repeat unit polymerase
MTEYLDNPSLRAAFIILFSGVVLAIYLLWPEKYYWEISAIGAAMALVFLVGRFQYLHPATCFTLPWIMIISFSFLPISTYHIELVPETYMLVFVAVFCWLLGSSAAGPMPAQGALPPRSPIQVDESALETLFIGCYAVFAAEIALSGFLPALSLILTGDSQYFSFGIPGIHGAFLAYANAIGCLAYFIYLKSGSRKHLYLYLSIIVIFALTFTRQNILTILVETVVIWSFVRKPIKPLTLALCFGGVLLAFSLAGTLRSGDITEIIKLRPEYSWLPTSGVWLYAYSYFNAMNLQNMLFQSGAPYYDGSSFVNLVPSFLRPITEAETYLVLSNMTVSSYIDPVYQDIGYGGIILLTSTMAYFTARSYVSAMTTRSFQAMAAYGCLYYCALLGFFWNNWFYLPVIFQLVFFPIIARYVLRPATTPLQG